MQLSEVLRLFDSPLSQEQCWSICYQVCKNLISMRNEDLQRKERIHYILSLDSLILTQRGEVEILQSEPSFQALQRDSELIFAIGNLICRCLDYGLDEHEISDVQFQDDLAELIGGMVLMSSEFDEGFDNGDQFKSGQKASSVGVRTFRTINEVVRFCDARLLRRNIEAKTHYKDVCKALYIEVSELKAFLGHILNDLFENKSKKYHQQPGKDLAGKFVKEWARIWITVMEELRKKTSERRDVLTPVDYEIAPFSKAQLPPPKSNNNNKLRRSFRKKSKENEDSSSKKEERIFDFLRSRSSTVVNEKLSSKKNQKNSVNAIEKAEENPFDRRSYNYASFAVNTGKQDSKKEKFSIFKSMKRKKSSNKTRNFPSLSEVNENERMFIEEDIRRREHAAGDGSKNLFAERIKERKQKLSPNKDEKLFFIGNEKDETDNLLTNKNIFVVESKYENIFKVTYQKPKTSNGMGNTVIENDARHIENRRQTYSHSSKPKQNLRQTKSLYDNKKTGSSLKEISKIRKEITRSELESAKSRQVRESKICFQCRKTKFSFFNKPSCCTICSRKYCSRCVMKKYDLPNHIGDSFTWKRENYRHKTASLPSRNMKGLDLNQTTLCNVCFECKRFVETIDTERHESIMTYC